MGKGKEDPARLGERKGIASLDRPDGRMCWIHAASVGEAQSALILINSLRRQYPDISILVTTGTVTSARLMETSLPEGAFHQFYPLDHPAWTRRFLEHWKPDFALWMESELWPNMLGQIKAAGIPCLLVNARLSPRSFRLWRMSGKTARSLLDTFQAILCQTQTDFLHFQELGAAQAVVTDNLKYSARPLPCDEAALLAFRAAAGLRPLWVFASTHKGEEELAARVHEILAPKLPDLLTIIVPRHPARRDAIRKALSLHGLSVMFRGEDKQLPHIDTDIYVADTLGELGLFYRAAPVAMVGRSFSEDGGGGHNPLEPAQLGCAVLHGPRVQNLQDIYDDMDGAGAAILCKDEGTLVSSLLELLTSAETLERRKHAALLFARSKENVIERVMPFIDTLVQQIKPPEHR